MNSDGTNGGGPFEAFIYLWFAFNGWGSCVTDADRDEVWVTRIANDKRLASDFDALFADSAFRVDVEQFVSWLPIFKMQELRKLNLGGPSDERRIDRVMRLLNRNDVFQFAPDCARAHLHDSTRLSIPADFYHVLRGIYRVRCNLFHGEKEAQSDQDAKIVAISFRILSRFLSTGGYLTDTRLTWYDG